jgi:hypothetical protein
MKIKVYIASPYTLGNAAENVRLQMDTANLLIDKGFAPFVPLYNHFQHMVHPRISSDWIELDNNWLLSCDCILRIGGQSKGADDEVKLAIDNDIMVFYDIDSLLYFYQEEITFQEVFRRIKTKINDLNIKQISDDVKISQKKLNKFLSGKLRNKSIMKKLDSYFR